MSNRKKASIIMAITILITSTIFFQTYDYEDPIFRILMFMLVLFGMVLVNLLVIAAYGIIWYLLDERTDCRNHKRII